MTDGDTVKFVYITAADYDQLETRDSSTVYFILSDVEKRIALGDVMFANYIPAHCTAISLNIESTTMGVGESIALIATTEPANPSDAIIWTASNAAVTITPTGMNNRVLISGVSEGSCTVTCTCGEVTATCVLEVHEAYIYTDHILAENHTPNGAKFIYTAPIHLTHGNYIEVSIDVSTVTGTKENIISIGQNIDVWQGSNTGCRTHMYITASTLGKVSVDLIQDTRSLRPTYILSGTTMVVRLDSSGLSINGVQFLYNTELRATPTLEYTTGMNALVSLSSYDIGSQEGSNRSHATYNYIKYVTTQYSE